MKKPLITKEKENTESGELRFQLYLAENQEEFPGTRKDSQRDALNSGSLDKSLKDKYRSPEFQTEAIGGHRG